MTLYIPIAGKYHFWKIADNLLNLHTPEVLKKGDTITVAGKEVMIAEIRADQQSSYYPNHYYYELKFKAL